MNQAFSLMPLHGMLSCVLPGAYVSSFGGRGQIFFPAWLGKNSTRSKNSRLLAEAKSHMSKRVSGNNLSIQLDYLPVLRATILQMLSSSGKDAVSGVIELLDEYGLTLEDFETTLFNSASLSGRPIQKIDSKIKAAITREYKKHHDLTVSKGKKTAKAAESMLVEEDDDNLAFEGEFVKTAEDNDESNPEESDSDISGLQKKSSGVAKSSSGRGGKSSSKTAKGTTSQAGRKTSSKKK